MSLVKPDPLERIAAALERLAPPAPEPADWRAAAAYLWDGANAHAIAELETTPLDLLRGIDAQKSAVCDNLARLASGAASHDMLLWGSRGMGKSALIRAAVSALNKDAPGTLALVQLGSDALATFPALIEQLRGIDRSFLLFIDDLGFGAGDVQSNLALRSLLDGGVLARPANIRVAVTSNRRAIVQREASESDARHERDERDNALALADRFGLTLAFHPCDRATFLTILQAYTDPLGLDVNEEEALAFSIARGSISGRIAYQFACELAGRAGLTL